MAIKAVSWSQNGGWAWQVALPNARVRLVAKGNGDYARNQRGPEGYSDEELRRIAEEIYNRHIKNSIFLDPYYGNVVEASIWDKGVA